MVSTFLGILIWEKLEQLMKAASPIDFNDSGKVTLANLEHSKKVFLPIASQPSEMTSPVILVHLEKMYIKSSMRRTASHSHMKRIIS